MAFAPSTVLERRREQMFPTLTPRQVELARGFGGSRRRYEPNEMVIRFGQVGAPAQLVLTGALAVYRRDVMGNRELITSHAPGQMAGETTQLAGGPSFVEVVAGPEGCEAILFDAPHVRSLMIGSADVGEMMMRAFILRRVALIEAGAGSVILGRSDSMDVSRLQNFLSRNGLPYTLLDPRRDAEAAQLIERLAINEADLPMAVCPDGSTLRNPTEKALAKCLGLMPTWEELGYDVAVVGAGPAGLATAVYAASEGLSVVVLDSRSFGGQAGASARIENYLGFPTGISGMALAGRAFNQAQKFGAVMAIPAEVKRLACGLSCAGKAKLSTAHAFGMTARRTFELTLDDDQRVRASAIVIASGARYRRPPIPNLAAFEGRGVYYWASPIEARLCAKREVALVGGGNSAGQAAVFLAGYAALVHILVRGPNLSDSMSRYLIDRIKALPNVELHTGTELTNLEGNETEGLQGVAWRDRKTGVTEEHAIRHVFLFTGADPNADWVHECSIATDSRGFVLTGGNVVQAAPLSDVSDGPARLPQLLETNQRGVFAIGDVRAGSIKRVASAVGEGAAVVAQIHGFLAAETHS